jgi:putative ABC transport system permease protein
VCVHLDILGQDLRFVRGSRRRAPGFTLTVIAVAALGVGATTAAFSVTDHVLIRPLPFPAADRLVLLWQQMGSAGSRFELSPANYRDWQRSSTSFAPRGGFNRGSDNLVGEGEPERLETATLTAEVIPLLGTRPLLGRAFSPEDDREGAPGTLLLSFGLWQERFGGDPGVLASELVAIPLRPTSAGTFSPSR